MFKKAFIIIFLFALGSNTNMFAQQIKGVVQDRDEKAPLKNVQLFNIYSNDSVYTDSAGSFEIAAQKGELIEVRSEGYNVAVFRLSQGIIPTYFKIYLDKTVVLNTDPFASGKYNQYQIDSIKSHELYKTYLDYPRMSAFEQIESPFTALSRSNQEKWAFQDSYNQNERERYIDFTFNEKLVNELTGLEGEELARYMKRYRPSYEALRSMSLYDYYTFIRQTAERFRRMGKPTHPRNSG